jgi:LSD1 subclass zinc finger protein
MTTGQGVSIELKELNNYPEFEEGKAESINSVGNERTYPVLQSADSNAPRAQNVARPATLPPQAAPQSGLRPQTVVQPTPVFNAASLRLSAPTGHNFYNFQGGMSYPVPGPAYSSIQCSGCQGLIHYPSYVSVVFCTHCKKNTATQPLLGFSCMYCKTSSLYSAKDRLVRCKCGVVYSIQPDFSPK